MSKENDKYYRALLLEAWEIFKKANPNMTKEEEAKHWQIHLDAERFLKNTPSFQEVIEDEQYVYTYNPETGWWHGVDRKTGEPAPYRAKFE